jgi:hypothetical protein
MAVVKEIKARLHKVAELTPRLETQFAVGEERPIEEVLFYKRGKGRRAKGRQARRKVALGRSPQGIDKVRTGHKDALGEAAVHGGLGN